MGGKWLRVGWLGQEPSQFKAKRSDSLLAGWRPTWAGKSTESTDKAALAEQI